MHIRSTSCSKGDTRVNVLCCYVQGTMWPTQHQHRNTQIYEMIHNLHSKNVNLSEEMKIQKEIKLPPHFFPVGKLENLQCLGIVMETTGFIPYSLTIGERNTTQLQDGIARNFLNWVQQEGGTLAWVFLATLWHDMRLRATMWMGLFPHSDP